MKIQRFYLILLIAQAIASCDKKESDNDYFIIPKFSSDQSEFSDQDLLNAAYSNYKNPENFFSEELEGFSLYYCNTISIDSLSDSWIELSTNSEVIARKWSKKSAGLNAVFSKYRETEKFFEYYCSSRQYDNCNIRFRVHNSSYFSRNDCDRSNNCELFGNFNRKDISVENSKELIDYLWFIRNYNNGSLKVISSFAQKDINEINVHHYLIQIVGGDWDLNDKITLFHSIYTIDVQSGKTLFSSKELRTIYGKHN